jgi:glycosyltransferase involved in cell wall biosynthesis
LHVGYGFRPLRGGGLIEYVEDLISAQVARGHQVAYFCSGRYFGSGTKPRLKSWHRRGVRIYEVVNSAVLHGGDRGTLAPESDTSDPPTEGFFRDVLSAVQPDLVHIQELAGLPSSLIEIAKLAGFPVVMTLQDYYLLCPTLKLYDAARCLCLKKEVGDSCVECCRNAHHNRDVLVENTKAFQREQLKSILPGQVRAVLRWANRVIGSSARSRRPQAAIRPATVPVAARLNQGLAVPFQRRRNTNVAHLNQVDALLAQSHRVEEIYRHLGVDARRIRTMQLTLEHIEHIKPRDMRKLDYPVHFATMNGCISTQKGAHVILGALRILREKGFGDRFRLLVWGGLLEGIREELLSHPNVTYNGWYNVDHLNSLLEGVHVGIMPSTWEEAYGFVGVEFLAKGVPVIGNALGGIVDYTKPDVTGWLNQTNSAEGLAEIMSNLISNPGQIEILNRSILANYAHIIKPMAQHADELDLVYRVLSGARQATPVGGNSVVRRETNSVARSPGCDGPYLGVTKLRILSLSSVYPSPWEPMRGIFVRARLQSMAKDAQLKVMAPIARLDWAHGRTGLFAARKIPTRQWDGGMEVLHPVWVYPPGGTWLNSFALAIQLLRPIGRLHKEFPFEVIDAHFGFPEGIAAGLLAAAFRCPFTITLRGSETVHAEKPLVRFWMGWALRRAGRVIAVSRRLADWATSLGAKPDKVRTVPNGVDAEIFFPRGRLACRERHGLLPRDRVILAAGHLIQLKRQHSIVQAMKALEERGLTAILLLAGPDGSDAAYTRRLRELATNLGLEQRVRFLGQVSPATLAELMSAADLLCHPSCREGWPNVVHEAMACGAPVVATDVGAIPEMLPSPEYGIVITVDDQDALVSALELALQKQWNRAAISAWAQSRSWEKVAHEVIEEMAQMMMTGNTSPVG